MDRQRSCRPKVPLPNVVVGIAFELERNTPREKRAEALPRGARELAVDSAIRETGRTVFAGDFT